LAKAGMKPSDVIVASTRFAADTLKLDQLGTIAPGKSADFVVLNANPLGNIANTRKIYKVYLRGEEVDRAAMRKQWTERSSIPLLAEGWRDSRRLTRRGGQFGRNAAPSFYRGFALSGSRFAP